MAQLLCLLGLALSAAAQEITNSSAADSMTSVVETTTNRFATPLPTSVALPTQSSEPGKGSSSPVGVIVAVAIVVPLFGVALGLAIFHKRVAKRMRAARQRGARPTGTEDPSFRTGSGGVSIPPPGGTGADRPADEQTAARTRRQRRRRQPSVRSVPEYSEDPKEEEIVLARSRSQRPRSSTAGTASESEQHLLLRSVSTRTTNTSSSGRGYRFSHSISLNHPEISEVDLSGLPAGQGGDVTGEAPPGYQSRRGTLRSSRSSQRSRHSRTESEPIPRPPGSNETPANQPSFVEIPLGRIATGLPTGPDPQSPASDAEFPPRPSTAASFGHRVNQSLSSVLSANTSPDPARRNRSSTLRSVFQNILYPGHNNGSTPSLLPTQRPSSSSSSLLHSRTNTASSTDTTSAPNRVRAATHLPISAPLRDSFVASAYEFPRNRQPTEQQMRFLGSVEELHRLGVGPMGASRASFANSASGEAAGSGGAGGTEIVPPPPFEETAGTQPTSSEAFAAEETSASSDDWQHREIVRRAPLLMPAYEVTPATPISEISEDPLTAATPTSVISSDESFVSAPATSLDSSSAVPPIDETSSSSPTAPQT